MLDVAKLVVLRSVAAEGSIAAAARRHGYTRSAISQQMSALERAAGTALLVRSGKSVTLTPIGQRLVEHTERVLTELRAAEAMLHAHDTEVSGRLRVGIPFREGPGVMSRALTRVRQRYPRLQLSLAATSEDTGPDELRHGRLDLVILSRFGSEPAPAPAGLRQWVLGHDALRLCVPAEHRLAAADGAEIAELRAEPWVLSPHSALGRLTVGACAAAGFTPTIAAAVDDVATALGLVGVGWGLTIAPELTPVGRDGGVRRLPLRGFEVFRHSVLLGRDGEQDFPHIAAVVAAVHEASATVDYLA